MQRLDRLESPARAITQRIALFALCGMLAFSLLTVLDIVLRRWSAIPLAGFNEVLALILPVTIVACFPAGLIARGHLRITFLKASLDRRIVHGLQMLGNAALLGVFGLLAWRIGIYASILAGRGAETTILKWPLAPAFWLVAVLFGVCAFVQALVLVSELRPRAASAEPRDVPPGSGARAAGHAMAFVCIATVLLAGIGVLRLSALPDFLPRDPTNLAIAMFLVMWALILLTVPLGAAMVLAGLAGTTASVGAAPGIMGFGLATADFLANINIAVLPLFLMMGSFAVAAGLSSDLYRLAHALLGRLRGGLALTTIGACAGFGAVTGLSVATVVTIGRVALPEMRSRGYSPALASGTIAAGATLGILVPPSGAMILYALLTDVSIGQMFVAALIPAAIATLLYMCAVAAYVRVAPAAAPPTERPHKGALLDAAKRSWAVAALFAVVIGGIYSGIFTETEAAAVGAGLAFLLALMRGTLRRETFWQVVGETVQSTSMVFLLLIGGLTFSYFVSTTGLAATLKEWIESLALAPITIISILILVYLVLGCVMDSFAIMVITVPILAPLVSGLGYDLIWWGIIMVMVIEIGLISPPFGVNVFVMKSLANDLPLGTIFRGVSPFLAFDAVRIALLVAFPALVTWLPSTM